jgi:hypothetical protein
MKKKRHMGARGEMSMFSFGTTAGLAQENSKQMSGFSQRVVVRKSVNAFVELLVSNTSKQ